MTDRLISGFERRHRSEQYLTCSQSFAHFRRQLKGSPQAAQVLWGRSAFFFMRGMLAFRGRVLFADTETLP